MRPPPPLPPPPPRRALEGHSFYPLGPGKYALVHQHLHYHVQQQLQRQQAAAQHGSRWPTTSNFLVPLPAPRAPPPQPPPARGSYQPAFKARVPEGWDWQKQMLLNMTAGGPQEAQAAAGRPGSAAPRLRPLISYQHLDARSSSDRQLQVRRAACWARPAGRAGEGAPPGARGSCRSQPPLTAAAHCRRSQPPLTAAPALPALLPQERLLKASQGSTDRDDPLIPITLACCVAASVRAAARRQRPPATLPARPAAGARSA